MKIKGRPFKVTPAAFHENAARFGPCAGPALDPAGDMSWFCEGRGTERLDPLADTFADADTILCHPCYSMREGVAVNRARDTMMERA